MKTCFLGVINRAAGKMRNESFRQCSRAMRREMFKTLTASGQSRDWKGHGHGYEGLLVDISLALPAVFDEIAAK